MKGCGRGGAQIGRRLSYGVCAFVLASGALSACGSASRATAPPHGPGALGDLTAALEDEVRVLPDSRIAWTTYWRLCWRPYPGATAYELETVTREGTSPALLRQQGRCFRIEVAAGENPRSRGSSTAISSSRSRPGSSPTGCGRSSTAASERGRGPWQWAKRAVELLYLERRLRGSRSSPPGRLPLKLLALARPARSSSVTADSLVRRHPHCLLAGVPDRPSGRTQRISGSRFRHRRRAWRC